MQALCNSYGASLLGGLCHQSTPYYYWDALVDCVLPKAMHYSRAGVPKQPHRYRRENYDGALQRNSPPGYPDCWTASVCTTVLDSN